MQFVKLTDIWVEEPRVLADGSIEMKVSTKKIYINIEKVFVMNQIDFNLSHHYVSKQGKALPQSFFLNGKEYAKVTRLTNEDERVLATIVETPEEILGLFQKKEEEQSVSTELETEIESKGSKRGRPKGSKKKQKENNITDSKESKEN